MLLHSAAVDAATRVEIAIDEPFAERHVAWPVTTGIPFPRGGLTDEDNCRLVDEQGVEHALQSRVTATWDAERKSIRWLTIDFVAQPNVKYWLEFGKDVARASFPSLLRVDRDTATRVSTGVITAEFSAKATSALGAIRADLNGDGKIAATEVVIRGANEGEHYFLDQNAQRHSNSRDGSGRKIVVETAGPVRACIRVDDFYTAPNSQPIVSSRTRYHLYAGLGLIKLIDEFKIIGSTKQTHFHDIGFALKLAGEKSKRRVTFDSSGKDGNQILTAVWKPDTKALTSYQSTFRHFGNPECRGIIAETNTDGQRKLHSSQHIGEWMQVADDRVAVTGSLRWLWQQFPKQWEVTDDEMIMHLWSPHAGPLDFGPDGLRKFFGPAGDKYILNWKGVRGTLNPISNFFYYAGHAALNSGDVDGQGINKHHEFYFHVAPAAQAADGQEYGRLAAKQPLALASGEWNCSTDVFGPLAARPNASKYEAIVDRIFDLGQKAQDDFGDYGWWAFGSGPHYSYQWDKEMQLHYADPRRFEYHTYQKETQLWWCYLRSGERKFYNWAFPSENHWVDIAVTHVPLQYQCGWRGGFRQKQTLHFRPGDWSIDSALFYVRQRDSAEAWLRGGSQFWASYHRTLETTSLAYYLTGDERYNDVLNFWREYWGDLAGKNSASPDFKPWHREQPWFQQTDATELSKTWAEMIRDYSPFTSGLRHQMTHFFNLATLYEHTWDPQIKQALEECAAAYLDPDHRIGVWRTQENGLPNHGEAPLLCHYWIPAMWKYARATRDPRMKKIFKKYFDACYAADPFYEDVGRYSNVHLGYAYYYTRDPEHLRPALAELDSLFPLSEPLKVPQELGRRIYNPYAPIQSLTAVPRLIWALDEAKRSGVSLTPPPPVKPQRTAIALAKRKRRVLRATLWGYEPQLNPIGPDGSPLRNFQVVTQKFASDIQPFDRNSPNFEVYIHKLTIPGDEPAGFYVLAPKLELAVLSAPNATMVNASRPIALEANESCWLPSTTEKPIEIESAILPSLKIRKLENNATEIRNSGRTKAWFQIVNQPIEKCWATFSEALPSTSPSREQTQAVLPVAKHPHPQETFTSGRFGKAVQIVPDRRLKLPDQVSVNGQTVDLFDLKQGTIEFWVKQQWDPRLVGTKRVTFLTNGPLQAWSQWKLPVGEWAHVAVEWRPMKRDAKPQAVHIYVNGHDQQNYRSTWWEGYSQKPRTFRSVKERLREFLCQTQPDAPFAFDELRISAAPRYTNLDVQFGGQQTFNPARFAPRAEPFKIDNQTLLLFHFDQNLKGASAKTQQDIEGRIEGN
ncbi:MAG: hypothetical protein CMJ78_23175 [Planctomycetaceae bacterium]|nr:hypothetical protein [Planctomycetaceae bacterium]